MAMQVTTPPRFIKLPTVKNRTSLSTSEIYRRIEDGTFPAQIKLGSKSVAWLEQEVDSWISKKIEQARQGEVTE